MASAAVGIAEHLGWAWFVTVAIEANEPLLLDSRRVELVASDLPCMPFHHDTDGMELRAADQLLTQVMESAGECALAGLKALKEQLEPSLDLLAVRHPPLASLPDSVAESRRSYHINCRGDGMLYHQAICAAAKQLGIAVVFHKRGEEERRAARSLGLEVEELQRKLAALGANAPNWTKEHRHAAAAAIAALDDRGRV